MIVAEITRPTRGQFDVIQVDTGFKADFYLAGGDELNTWGFRYFRKLNYRSESITVAP